MMLMARIVYDDRIVYAKWLADEVFCDTHTNTNHTSRTPKMNTVNPVTATVQEVAQPKPPLTVTLTMPEEVAVTLKTIMNSIGGHPMYSRRQHADMIRTALSVAGIDELSYCSPEHQGKIEFSNNSDLFSDLIQI